jgi:hypothetical protein
VNRDQAIREAAEKRIKARAGFWRLTGIFVIVWGILIGTWWLTTGWNSYFWPAWAIFGMCIGLAFTAWGAYGPRERIPSDAEIDAEVRAMTGSQERDPGEAPPGSKAA